MSYLNNAALIRRELIKRLIVAYLKENPAEFNRIPVDMFPKSQASIRCCIYKDRAMIKYRLMALMGHRIEEEEDELTTPQEYFEMARERDGLTGPVLTVLDEACSGCIKVNYMVTNACRGCVARPCMMNCKKDAISFVHGKAEINHENCVNCGLCMNECPYHAIIYIPVPCEESCPVGAISKDENGKETIDYDKCTFCGKCMSSCPFGAIMERSQIIDVLQKMKSGKEVIAMVAPAAVTQFSTEPEKVFSALKNAGFTDVIEVAYGADLTSEHEAEELTERLEKGDKFMTSSCCPAYIETVNKHIPALKDFVSETPTPLHYTAEWLHNNHPDAVKVFVSPCVAKRNEALNDDVVDYVVSIEEVGSLFLAKDIDVQKCEPVQPMIPAGKYGRGFPVSGGVTQSVLNRIKSDKEVSTMLIDGINKKSIKELARLPKTCNADFVEVMCCEGGCNSGPNVICNPKLANRGLQKYLLQSK